MTLARDAGATAGLPNLPLDHRVLKGPPLLAPNHRALTGPQPLAQNHRALAGSPILLPNDSATTTPPMLASSNSDSTRTETVAASNGEMSRQNLSRLKPNQSPAAPSNRDTSRLVNAPTPPSRTLALASAPPTLSATTIRRSIGAQNRDLTPNPGQSTTTYAEKTSRGASATTAGDTGAQLFVASSSESRRFSDVVATTSRCHRTTAGAASTTLVTKKIRRIRVTVLS